MFHLGCLRPLKIFNLQISAKGANMTLPEIWLLTMCYKWHERDNPNLQYLIFYRNEKLSLFVVVFNDLARF